MQIAVPIPPDLAFAQAKWDALSGIDRGARILAAMNACDATKSDLADRLHVTFQAVNAWCLGDTVADWARWMAVSLALGIDQTWEPTTAQLSRAKAEIKSIRDRRRKDD